MFGEYVRLLRTSHTNVRITLVVYFFSCLSGSIWAGTFLSAYLLEKTGGSNLGVGAIEAASGVSELIMALPVGYFADKVGKARITKIGVSVGVIAPCLIATAIVLQVSAHRALMLLTIGMIVGGLQDGLLWGPLGALFADSVRSGQRSRSYLLTSVVVNIASMAGPAITIGYFSLTNNVWHIRQIEIIILVGLTMYLPMILATWFLTEADADGDALKRRRRRRRRRREKARAAKAKAGSRTQHKNDRVTVTMTAEESDERTPLMASKVGEDEDEKDMHTTPASHLPSSLSARVDEDGGKRKLHALAWMIPYIIFVGDLVSQLGTGMTLKCVCESTTTCMCYIMMTTRALREILVHVCLLVYTSAQLTKRQMIGMSDMSVHIILLCSRFIPLWWKRDVHLTPVAVQMIFLAEPVVVIFASWIAVWLSKRIGRVVVCMASTTIAAGALASLVLMFYQKAPLAVLIAIYIARSGFKVLLHFVTRTHTNTHARMN